MKGALLDTHVWIWFMLGDKTLSPKLRKMINSHIQAGTLWLSAISVWELGMLEHKDRITLTQPCLEWTEEALKGINLAELTPQVTVESCNLPGDFHGDQANRIIVATARNQQLELITRDQAILAYGKKHFLHVIKA